MSKPFEGFDRIVINYEGEAWSPRRAKEIGVLPDVGFLRDDGWALGAPKYLEDVAFRLWANEWTHRIDKPEICWKPLKKVGE